MKPRPTLALIACCTLMGCSTMMNWTNSGSENFGKRTAGTVMDDQLIESRAKVNIENSHEALKKAKIDVNSFNGIVLLTGQVESEDLKALASSSIQDLRKVRKVHNELRIAGPTSLIARTNDAWLTTKIKSLMAASKEVSANRIKVVTENGVVFLMGLLTTHEADAATRVARSAYGVQKIVKVFEYIN